MQDRSGRHWVVWGILAGVIAPLDGVWALERVQPADATLDCTALQAQTAEMDRLIQAGSTERTVGTAAAGTAANVGGQVAAAQVAGGLFGALGGLATRLAGAAAQTAVEKQMGPDEAARTLATQAGARKDFLTRLMNAKDCAAGGAGQPLTPDAFDRVAKAPPIGTIAVTALSSASVQEGLQQMPPPLDTAGVLAGRLDFKGKKVFVSEFRVLFEVGGEVSGSTRSGYLLGTDYGSTRATVTYKVSAPDIAAFQAITDKAFEDFKARMSAAGVDLAATAPDGGAVYTATEAASTPGQPVTIEKNLGHSKRRFVVLAPTGMKLLSRGLAGIGAGDIGKRIEWSRAGWEGVAITQTVSIAELESSGSASSILRRNSSAEASSQLTVGNAPDDFVMQTHVGGGLVRIAEPVRVPGSFANFRTVGGFDSRTDTTSQVIGRMQNMMGQGANQVVRVDKEVDLDGPSLGRMALQGLVTINQAMADFARSSL